jgi:hypothetical protein
VLKDTQQHRKKEILPNRRGAVQSAQGHPAAYDKGNHSLCKRGRINTCYHKNFAISAMNLYKVGKFGNNEAYTYLFIFVKIFELKNTHIIYLLNTMASGRLNQ